MTDVMVCGKMLLERVATGIASTLSSAASATVAATKTGATNAIPSKNGD